MLFRSTIPGVQHIRRFFDGAGCPMGDMIVDDSVERPGSTTIVDVLDPETTFDLGGFSSAEVLEQVVSHGRATPEGHVSIEASKERCRDALMHLDPATRRFLNPQIYPVGMEEGLAQMRLDLAREERAHSGRR